MALDGSVSLKAKLDTTDVSQGVSKIKASLQGVSDVDKKFNWSGLKSGTSESGLLSKAADVAKKGLSAIGSAAVTAGKVGAAAIGGMTAAIGGLALTGGISRAMAISEAQAKMNQLGMDTDKVMSSVKESVSGTKFALNEAASSAVTLGSAGIAAGEDMTQALKSIASTASISGAEFSEIGSIYSKVAASGKLSTEVMNQLLERGVSVTAALSQKLGVTQDRVREMVTNGEIDFKTFSEAMQEYLGDAADSANSTFSGAMANVRAALSRVGAAFADPALEALRQVFVALIPAIDAFGAAIEPLVEAFTSFVNDALAQVLPLITAFTEAMTSGSDPLSAFTGLVAGLADVLTDVLLNVLQGAVDLIAALIPAVISMIPSLLDAFFSLFLTAIEALNGIGPQILNALPTLIRLIIKSISTFAPQLLAQAVKLFTQLLSALGTVASLLIQAIPDLIVGLVDVILENAPTLLDSAVELFTQLVEALVVAVHELLAVLPDVIKTIVDFFIDAAPTMLAANVEMFMTLVDAVVEILPLLVDAFLEIIPMLVEVFPTMIETLIDGLLTYLGVLTEAAVLLFTALVDALIQIIPVLVDILPDLVMRVATTLIDHLPELLEAALTLFMALVEAFVTLIPRLLGMVPELIVKLGSALISNAPTLVAKVGELLGKLITTIGNWIARDLVPSIASIPQKIASNFKLPKIPLPHFKISGSLDLTTMPPQIPSVGIDWYAKGGIFDSASIIGVGEAGAEAVVPLSGSRMQPFADAVAEGINGGDPDGSGKIEITINIEQFINSSMEDLDELVDRLVRDIQRKLDYETRAKGLSV